MVLLTFYQEKRQFSYEYGRYGNPTTAVLEEKMRFVFDCVLHKYLDVLYSKERALFLILNLGILIQNKRLATIYGRPS